MEEGYYPTDAAGAGDPQPADYDQVFPALPVVQLVAPQAPHMANSWNNKMRIGTSIITQVFQVPPDERRIDQNDSFGEKESLRHCANIMKETDAHIELSSCKNGSLTFLVSGKLESVLDARRRILQTFQTQASSTISIPRAHHKVILGKSGQRLRDLEKQTSTRISVPVISEQSDMITIQGTKDNIDKAIHEIHKISVEQAKKAFEEIHVDKELHPFIVGANNEKVMDLMNETNTRIHVPPLSVQASDISIAGEKDGVEFAKKKILAQVEQMKKKYTHVSIEVSKAQHKYVIGHRGSNIAEILKTCGVSVEMPPLDSQLETITLRGPQDKLGVALSKVYDKANSGKTTELSAPSWINFYIIGKKGANIKQVTQDFPKVHVQFNQEEEKVTIEGPPDDVDAVAGILNQKISSLLQDKTFQILTVDPKHFKHIIGKSGANINRLKDQTGVEIKISGNDETQNTIKITGSKEGVSLAARELEEQIAKMELEKEKDVVISCKYHKVLIGHQGANVKEIRDKFPEVQITFPSIEQKSDVVKLRGPKDKVDKCAALLSKKVKEILENNSHTLTLPVYEECQKIIIGKGGANIRKLRDETNTLIELPEGRNIIIITGKKENVCLAKERIMSLQQQQISAVTEEVRISSKFYNALIGPQGKIISSIEEDCGVKITFPSADSKSDLVTVVGLKEGVEKAKALLLEQVSEREANSFTVEIRTNHQNHKFLIGKSGSKIKKIRESTGTRIIFPSKDDDKELITIMGKKEAVLQAKAELEAAIEKINSVVETELEVDPKHHKHFVAKRCEVLHQIEEDFSVTISFPRSGDCSNRVTVKGPPNLVEPAKQRIREIVKDLDERIEISVNIPSVHHSAIMGFKGTKVKDIEYTYDVKIKMPEKVLNSNVEPEEDGLVNGGPRPQDLVKVSGKPENCEQAKEALLAAIPITVEVEVPYEYHGGIIGNKGQSIRDLMDRYGVNIEVPKTERELNTIKIIGCPSAIEAAKEGLQEKIKDLDEEKQDRLLKSFKITITIDPEYHPKIIGKKGATITKIKEDFGVQINIPRKGEPDEEIITITGYEDKVHQARDEILSIVSQLNERAREEVMIDSRVHSRLIGSKGRNIRKIMDEYNVEIKFPRTNGPEPNLVVISGDEERVLDAKEKLLMLEEEFLEDVRDRDRYQIKREEVKAVATNGSGYVVKGAPWERGSGGGGGGGGVGGADRNTVPVNNAPDVASQQDFPSFQGSSANTSNKSTPWGPRR